MAELAPSFFLTTFDAKKSMLHYAGKAPSPLC